MTEYGSVSGDVVSGNKTVTQTAGGDIVGGDKITHSGTGHIFAGPGDVIVVQPQLAPASARDRANLLLLLKKVRTFWIEGVLERSVHTAMLLELGRELRPDAIDHPWASVLELPNASRRALPAATQDVDVFDEANRALLILGAPGSGKTTTLLEIARDLLARAEADAAQPVPVVFSLSTWHARRLPLGAWLVSELASKYQVPRRVGRAWLQDQRLLPLLDGLDEVDPHWQAACVRAINQYVAAPGLPGVVVCCRVEEYTRLPARLRLNGAICLNPLTPEQVDAYLQVGGAQLAALRASLQSDDGLAVLAQTPLFLSIMCLAYQDLKPEQLVSPAAISVEERRRHLFEHYVGRMLKRKGQRPGRAADARLLRWLNWLARHMTARNLTVFLSERLQPDWIDDDRGRWLYALASRLSLWLSLGLGMTLAWLALSATLYAAGGSVSDYLASMFSGPLLLPLLGQTGGVYRRYVTPGVVAGLILGVRFAFMALRGQVADKQASGWRRASVNVLLGIGVPVLAATLPNIVQLLTPGFSDVAGSLIGMSTYWGLVMLLAAIAFRARGQGDSLAADIPTVDSLDWSWLQSLRGVVAGFISGAVLAAAFAAVTAWSFRSLELLVVMTICSVPGGLLGALTAGAVAGLRGRAAPELPKTHHWVARHVRNALSAGTLLGLVLGLSGTLVGLAIFYLPTFIGVGTAAVEIVRSAALGVMTGAVAGTVAALHFGGAGLIQRAALRLVLVVRRHTPWRISRLADQAEDLVLLRRVGSGYIFIHRLVMEYFAGLKIN